VSSAEAVQAFTETSRAGVVLSGSFRRGLEGLRADFSALVAADCEVLSPADVRFVREEDGFVFAEHEIESSASEIESAHLAAIRRADFVWLHVPDGYLGPSGAFELGVAAAGGVPVFARQAPRDVALREYVRVVSSPTEAAAYVRANPITEAGAGVRTLQAYYGRAAQRRGWAGESPIESMVLLTEEIGELARAVREHTGLKRRTTVPTDPSEELADVQLYVVHLANVLGVDLADAVSRKELENARRFALTA
jgi:NTP pyrophosphatase (non-canonical NTP hydrolase)